MQSINKYYFFVLIFQLIGIKVNAQFINNGSFEGNLGINDPIGWNSCLSSTSTDILPGQWNINLQPYHGPTYLGMVCRGDFNVNSNNCEELQQTLNVSLKANKCYQLNVYLAYSDNFSFTVFRNALKLNIFLGNSDCVKSEQIAEFKPVDNTDWQRYSTHFVLDQDMTNIFLEADYISLPTYFGNILIDSLSIVENTIDFPSIDLGADTLLCENESLILSVQNSNDSILWSTGLENDEITIFQAGEYWVEVSSLCGSSYDTINVDFESSPTLTLGIDTTLCNNEEISLDAQNPGSTYLWNNGQTNQIITTNQTGTYVVEVENECGNTIDTINVKYESLPVLKLGTDTTLCDNEEISLDAQNPGSTYLWNDGQTNQIITTNQTGTYVVEVENECGNTIDTINVKYESLPVLDLGTDTTLCDNEEFSLDAQNPGSTYLWNDGQTNQIITTNQTGTYIVEVENDCGSVNDSVEITFEFCDCDIYIPNAFSPNDDGINDFFRPLHNCDLSVYNLKIFTRWGELVFESSAAFDSWNGKINDKYAAADVYIYKLVYQTESEPKIEYGTVTIIE